MRRPAVFGIVVLASVGMAVPAGHAVSAGGTPDQKVIVILKDSSASPEVVADQHSRSRRARVSHVYSSALRGYSAAVPADQVAALRADPQVEAVVADKTTSFEEPTSFKMQKKKAPGYPQLLPFSIDRIDGDLSSAKSGDGRGKVDVDVAVIDTGVGPHNDINVVGGVNCGTAGSSKKDWTGDVQPHGTEVAGVIGSADNSRDWVGVAPGARIWSVRVDNVNQDTELSNVICGIDWVTRHADSIEVVNMSIAFLGSDDHNCGRTNNDALHRAVCRMVAAGVTVVAAAGNESADAATSLPAAYDEVIGVSAMVDFDGSPGGLAPNGPAYLDPCPIEVCLGEVDDTRAFFSNFGSVIDMTAPGVFVETQSPFGVPYPTLDSDGYSIVAGTSFSSPHVAGAAALFKSQHRKASPAQVKAALLAAGTYNYDDTDDPDGIKEPLLNVAGF